MYNIYEFRPSYREFGFWYASVSLPAPTPSDCRLIVYTMYYQQQQQKWSGNQHFDEISYICSLTWGSGDRKGIKSLNSDSPCKCTGYKCSNLRLSLFFINAYLVTMKKNI